MKISIKIKLFIWLNLLVIFFVLFTFFLNSNYLEKYYITHKKNVLLDSYNSINTLLKNESIDIELEIEKLEKTNNLSITIVDNNYDIKYDSGLKLFNTPNNRIRPMLNTIQIKSILNNVAPGEIFIGIIKDTRLNSNFIILSTNLNDTNYIIISTPLAAIKESVSVSNKFLLISGLIMLILGSIIGFILSKRFTKPVLKLKEISQKMTNLDFSEKYEIRSKDEIGELGQSINSLSDQLDQSITQLKIANQKLIKDIEEKEKIDSMRKEFISNVSHELKTPISLIQGYAEGLKVNINEDQENKDFYCDVIMDETSKMDKLVKDLLNLSQMESGYSELQRSEFDICEFTKYILEKYNPIFQEKNITHQLNFNENIVVYADKSKIEQVIVNFLTNAINHVDDNKIIKIDISLENDVVDFSIFNSGEHIPEDSLEKIWHSFYKVDKARTREYGGTGLGLSITSVILDKHNASYGVNNVEKGVQFWFKIKINDKNIN